MGICGQENRDFADKFFKNADKTCGQAFFNSKIVPSINYLHKWVKIHNYYRSWILVLMPSLW